MIVSFSDRATEDLFHGVRSNRVRRFPPNIVEAALQKLDILNAAHSLEDLRSPPGNRLEALRGDLQGFYSNPYQQSMAYCFPLAGVAGA
jgi:proteic killer suppression protein